MLDAVDDREDRRLAHKIRTYIQKDKFHKLSSFFDLQQNRHSAIHPDSPLNSSGQTGLHFSAKLGHPDCVRVFLELGANPKVQDRKGNTPLHYGCKYCLKNYSVSNVRDLVKVFIRDDLDLLEIKNKNGTTPATFVEALNKLEDSSSDGEDKSSVSSEVDDDSKWQEKLRQADEEDYFQFHGKYEQHESYFRNVFNESYDQWADRIYSEFRAKRDRIAQAEREKFSESKDKDGQKSRDEDNIEKKEWKLKLKDPKIERFRTKYKKLFFSSDPITVALMPFKTSDSAESIVELLLSAPPQETPSQNAAQKDEPLKDDDAKATSTRKLREAIRKWHPDKFNQLFRSRIQSDSYEDVMKIVTHVSQSLLNFGKQ